MTPEQLRKELAAIEKTAEWLSEHLVRLGHRTHNTRKIWANNRDGTVNGFVEDRLEAISENVWAAYGSLWKYEDREFCRIVGTK